MRFAANGADRSGLDSSSRANAKRPDASHRSVDLIPLYDHDQFLFLVERERARADRAAAKPPKAPRRKASQEPAAAQAVAGGQPKPSSAGVWGATTDNREFSLVIFRPQARADRPGLVELLQCCVRTTDAVGVIDTRRLGVLLPDTAAANALLFVRKVLALAQDQGVQLNHIVHTYPAAWPDEDSPMWNEPRRSAEQASEVEGQRTTAGAMHSARRTARRSAERGVVRSFVNWLQAASQRRAMRREVRASA